MFSRVKFISWIFLPMLLIGKPHDAHALSGKVGDWTLSLSGFALAEWWLHTDQVEGDPAEGGFIENDIFLLHLIELGGTRPLHHDLQFEWKIATRLTNGNFFGTGNGYWRDAYAGITGKFGSIKLGRFVTKAWLMLDYPYGQSGINEFMSETGAADWSTASSIRYSSPVISLGQKGGLAFEATVGSGQVDEDSWGTNIEGFLGLGYDGFNLELIYQRTDGENKVGHSGSGGYDGPGCGAQGWCARADGEQGDVWQHMIFAGARYAMSNGLQFLASARINQWHNKEGLSIFNVGPKDPLANGRPDAAGERTISLPTDLTAIQLTATASYGTGRWFFSGSYSHTLESMIDGVAEGDTLDDASGTIGARVQYNIGDLVFLYVIARHMMRYGDYLPAMAQPWQFNNLFNGDVQGDTTRIIFGTQALFF